MTNKPFLIDYQAYRSILCLDGSLPSAEFFNCKLPIIAADGAANKLVAMGITPALIIGDFDAVDPVLLETIQAIHIPEQDTNDYQKALAYLSENQLLPTIVCGVNGGYLDHILNNVNIFMQSDNLLYAPPIMGFVLKDRQRKSLTLPLDTKISLLGIPNGIVSSSGLKWELDSYQLTFPGQTSCFNRSVQPMIEVSSHEGKTLVLIYQ